MLGVDGTTHDCWLSRILAALRRLSARPEQQIESPIVAAAAGVDAEELVWIVSAYHTTTPLYPKVVALLDARRRRLGRSIAATLDAAMRDAAADVDRAIAIALAQLRRARR